VDYAQHIWISELLSGSFIQVADAPSKLQTREGHIVSRMRVYGIVVSTDELIVDDGTGSILVRSFEPVSTPTIGETVLIIGRPRLYENNPYLLGEIVKRCDPKWIDIAKKTNPLAKNTLELIRELDNGEGADYEHVLNRLGSNGEEVITQLLANGELFETRPGKLKLLE